MNEELILIDDENLEIISNKMELYLREEKELYVKLNDNYNDIKNIYKSRQNELDFLESEILMNIRKAINNRNNNIYLIRKRIEKVKEFNRKAKALDDSVSIGRIV